MDTTTLTPLPKTLPDVIASSGNAFLSELAEPINNGTSNEWTDLLATTGAPEANGASRFGGAVAITSTHALIGARRYTTTSSFAGNAFLYELADANDNGTSNEWTNLVADTGSLAHPCPHQAITLVPQ